MVEARNSLVRQQERNDIKMRGPLITDLARQYLINTALVDEKRQITEDDINAVRRMYVAVAPYAHPKVYPDLWNHLLLASIYGRRLSQYVPNVDMTPNEAEAIGLLNDFGSVLIPHRYYRKNVVDDLLKRNVGIRQDILDRSSPVARILGRLKPISSFSDMTIAQRESDIADNLSKTGERGILTTEEIKMRNDSQAKRYEDAVFTSERWGLRALVEHGKQKLANTLLDSQLQWFSETYGVDFDHLREIVWEEYQEDENQQWLLQVKNAQEKLDIEIDKKLKRPKIATVVFDVGGVLFKDADPLLAAAMSKVFARPIEEVWQPILDRLDVGMAGLISEEEFLNQYYQALGLATPSNIEIARAPFIYPEAYIPNEGMQDLVEHISDNKDLRVFVLSDAIPPLKDILKIQAQSYYPMIKKDQIIVSSEIRASKRSRRGDAFGKLLSILGDPDPQSILFIDDNASYTTKARAQYNIRSLTFRGNRFDNQSSEQRIRQEMLHYGLIS